MEDGLSKAFLKKLGTLDDVKGRRRTGLFVAEGTKCVGDTARAFKLRQLLATHDWLDCHADVAALADEVTICTRDLLGKATRLTATPPVIGLFALPDSRPTLPDAAATPVLALDRIQDPGNMGTIVRTCDWMGVRSIVASPDTVDIFNPKAVQASMGAISNVAVSYMPLTEYLRSLPAGTPVYGTFLDGEDAFDAHFHVGGVIIMGNEGRGISDEVAAMVTHRLTIPAFVGSVAESLNVAAATAMLLAVRRKDLQHKTS